MAELTHALTPIDKLKSALTGRYLVKGLIDRGAMSCLFGAPNSGKTFLALDLSLHIAAGMDWYGHRVSGPAPVVYVSAEGKAAFGNRLAALRKDKSELFALAADGGMAVLPVALDLCAGDDASALSDMITRVAEDPALIVIDTLARSMGAGNENDSSDMGAVIRAVSDIQNRTRAHVMLVHHTGKNTGSGARGHSSLLAALDTELELSDKDDVLQIRATKQRDLAVTNLPRFQLRPVYLGDDEDGDEVFSCVLDEVVSPPERGVHVLNAKKKQQAAGRADEAMLLLPVKCDFTAADVADRFASAGIVNASGAKSLREATRAKLKSMAASGALEVVDGGPFRVRLGGAK